MLPTLGEGGGIGLQLSVESQVVVQRQELPDDDQSDHDEQAPEDDGIELTGLQLFEAGNDRGGAHRKVGKQQPQTSWRPRRGCRQRGGRRGDEGSDGDQQVAGGPAGIDHVSRPVRIGRGQVGKAAIGEEIGQQSTGEQVEGQSRCPRGAGRQDDDHGGDHDVAGGVGKTDQLGPDAVRPTAIDRAQHGCPTDDQE